MIYLYDNAIAKDLQNSLTAGSGVRVVEPEDAIGIAAQLQNDEIKFPLVVLHRNPTTPVDTDRANFTRIHKGVSAAFDKESNNIYHEKSIPIDLRYAITVLTTRVADMDEIVKELLFKYYNMYFLTIELPYESRRKIRFGITVDSSEQIERSSSVKDYLASGTLHQTIIPLRCEGCILVSYTPRHLRHYDTNNIEIQN